MKNLWFLTFFYLLAGSLAGPRSIQAQPDAAAPAARTPATAPGETRSGTSQENAEKKETPPVRLVVHPDGALRSYRVEGKVVVVRDEKGEVLDKLSTGKAVLAQLEISPDGRLLGVRDADGKFAIWYLEKKQARTLPLKCAHPYSTLAFSSDNRLMATATCESLALWDVQSGELIREIKSPPLSGFLMRFAPDGSALAVLRLDDKDEKNVVLRIDRWSVANGTLQNPLEYSSGYTVTSLAFSTDGSRLAVGLGIGRIYILDAITGKVLRDMYVGGPEDVSALAFSSDNRFLISGDEGKDVRLWNVETGREVISLKGHEARVADFAWSTDATQIRSVDADGKIRRWSPLQLQKNFGGGTPPLTGSEKGKAIPRPQLVPQTGHTDGVLALSFSPDGRLLASGGKDQRVLVWDLRSNRQMHVLAPNAGDVKSIEFASDGKTLVIGCSKGGQLWDVESGQIRRPPERSMPNPVVSARSAPRIAYQSGRGIGIWDVAADKPVGRIVTEDWNWESLAINPPGEIIALNDKNGAVQLWDVTSGKMMFKTEVITERWKSSSFSPDGKVLAVADAAKTLYLWKVEKAKLALLHEIEVPDTYDLLDLDFSPDSKTLVLGDQSQWSLRFYNVASGEPATLSKAQFDRARWSVRVMSAVAYSPDGNWIAGKEGENEIKLWNVKTGQGARVLASQVRPYDDAFFVSNSEVLTAGGKRGQIDLWNLEKADLATRFGENLKYGAETMAMTSDRKLLTVGRAGAIDLYQWPERALIASLPLPESTETWNTWPEKVLFSPDGRKVACSSNRAAGVGGDLIGVWNVATRKLLYTPPLQREDVLSFCFSPDSKLLAWGCRDFKTEGDALTVWRVEENREAFSKTIEAYGIYSMTFSPDGKTLLCGTTGGDVQVWDIASGQVLRTFEADKDTVSILVFSPDGKTLLCGADNGRISLWNTADWSSLQSFVAHADEIRSIGFSPDGKRFVSAGSDGITKVWEYPGGENSSLREVAGLISNERGQFMLTTPQGFYRASQRGLGIAAFRYGERAYPVEQFDVRLNRPDEVLKNLQADDALIAAAHAAYLKRLRRMKLTPEMLGDDFHLPEVEVISPPPLSSETKNLAFKIRARDQKYALDRLNVFINDVPVYGANGIDVKAQNTRSLEHEIELELSNGANKIQVSALNIEGVESMFETFEIACTASAPKPTLHVVCVGVSKYADSQHDLNFADKDAKDLADFFTAQKKNFERVAIHALLNEQATKANILNLKTELSKTATDDQVILFFAGHGLLDEQSDYYFATHDVDFNQPAQNGLSYEAIEELLDGIPARRKLLMMDTCHAGEVDKDDIATTGTFQTGEGTVTGTRATRVLVAPGSQNTKTGSALLPELFADLRRGSGAQVIAASGGLEYSLESAQWNNGVFTFSVLDGLQSKRADSDKNGKITVSELRDYVAGKVLELTRGRQRPTARRENLESDFVVF